MKAREKTKYRTTSIWKDWRRYLLNKRGCTCEICSIQKRSADLQIHHLDEEHYKDLKENKFSILCKRDHQLIEQLLRRKEFDIDSFCSNLKRVYQESKNNQRK